LSAIDFDKVVQDAATTASIVDIVIEAYVATLPSSYAADDLRVVLTKGSVKATVTIMPKVGYTVADLMDALTRARATVQALVSTKLRELLRMEEYLETGKMLTDLKASASAPVETVEIAGAWSTTLDPSLNQSNQYAPDADATQWNRAARAPLWVFHALFFLLAIAQYV
jgi:hypothetical protein